jgi:[ribosomal protein S5]-alanine N-acetyltransferase
MQPPANIAFAIRRRDDGVLVGYADITNIVRGLFLSAYLGYYVFRGHERQGLMKEGLQLVILYAFGELRLHRLEANIQPENVASKALIEACGFSKEGYSPRYLKIRGRWRDHERWALLAR